MLPHPGESSTDQAALDRTHWAAALCFVSYGVRIGVRVNRADVLEQLLPHLPPGWRPARRPVLERLYSLRVREVDRSNRHCQVNSLYAGPVRLARNIDLDPLLDLLQSDLQLYVATAARRRVFVHAGVVGWRGRAILLPGRSFSGKTTLVAALVRAGATYYSDEYAVLDEQGRVHPYPRLLSIREEGKERTKRCPPEAFGGVAGVGPLPVGLIAVTRYRPGAQWRASPLSPGQAALALVANTVSARRRPAAMLAAVQNAVSRARALKGVRGEAEHVVDVLLNEDWG